MIRKRNPALWTYLTFVSTSLLIALMIASTVPALAEETPGPQFSRVKNVPLGEPWAEAVAVADVTGDGLMDILSTQRPGNGFDRGRLRIIKGTRGGGPAEPVTAPGDIGQARFIATGDLTGDGLTDVALAHGPSLFVYVQRAGKLSRPELLRVEDYLYGIEIADLDHDDDLDVVVSGHDVTVFYQTESGLEQEVIYEDCCATIDIDVGDLNHDGLLDLAVANWREVVIHTRTLDGSYLQFRQVIDDQGYYGPESIEIADFDDDGWAELAVARWGPHEDRIHVFQLSPAGPLVEEESYPSHENPLSLESADLNNDDRADLLVGHSGYSEMGAYIQTDDGDLTPECLYDGLVQQHSGLDALAAMDVDSMVTRMPSWPTASRG